MSSPDDGSSSSQAQVSKEMCLPTTAPGVICIDSIIFSAHCLPKSQYGLSSDIFGDILDSIMVDVASECHRIARLGLDLNLDDDEEELRLSVRARAEVSDPSNTSEANSKYAVDIYGQTHPAIASEVFDCMNCGRPIVAGRFAPHLEKCMGKGRKARVKATRSSTITQNRHSRGSPIAVYAPYPNANNTNRLSNGVAGAGEHYPEASYEDP